MYFYWYLVPSFVLVLGLVCFEILGPKQTKQNQLEVNINLYVASLASNRVGGVGSVLRILCVKITRPEMGFSPALFNTFTRFWTHNRRFARVVCI